MNASNPLMKLDTSGRRVKTTTEVTNEFVTMRLDGQLFGLPVPSVQDVLRPHKLTQVPLASPEVAGLINLRGRIVTVIDMRRKMGMKSGNFTDRYMEIVVEHEGELYSLMVDSVNEVMNLPESMFENTPPNLAPEWQNLASGVYRLENELMVVLDITAIFKQKESAA